MAQRIFREGGNDGAQSQDVTVESLFLSGFGMIVFRQFPDLILRMDAVVFPHAHFIDPESVFGIDHGT